MPEKVLETVADRRRTQLREARLYLVCESESGGRRLLDWVGAAIDAGVDVVQLRDKQRSGADSVAIAGDLRAVTNAHGALFLINDDPELAVASGADGVHVGQDDLAPARAREIVGGDLLVGQSTHSPEQIAAAEHDGDVDYIGVGPVFATPTKPGRPPVGTDLVEHAGRSCELPYFAIGGIDPSNAGVVVGAGARRIAVVRAIRDAADPAKAARSLIDALEVGRG